MTFHFCATYRMHRDDYDDFDKWRVHVPRIWSISNVVVSISKYTYSNNHFVRVETPSSVGTMFALCMILKPAYMLLNYLKIAIRTLLKKRVYTFINILGLSVGAAASLIIFLYVYSELSYDKFLPESGRIYRMVEDRIYPDRVAYFAMIPGGFSGILADEIPEVESSTRLVGFPNFSQSFRYNDQVFSENYFFSADSNFFDVLPFKLLKGNPDKVLRTTRTIVLTESTARRYFGDDEPIGKMIQADTVNIEVVGVMEDVPENSHMKFDALRSVRDFGFLQEPNYYVAGTFTYVKLVPGANPKNVDAKMPALIEKYAAGQIERDIGVSFKKYIEGGNGYRYYLQPIHDIHLKSQRSNEIKANGSIIVVNALIFVSIIILVIAGINFVNLATARSAERAKEVGVRKVLGSKKKQLIIQFLSESTIITMVSIIIAIVIIQTSLGWFNTLSGKQLQLDPFANPGIIAAILSITIGLGVFAGLYPAFYISALKPVQVLKGKFQTSSRGSMLRNALVVFQFAISFILIVATLVVYDQVQYMQNKTLGFEKENLIVINHTSAGNQSQMLHDELKKVPGVEDVGAANSVPGGYYYAMMFKLPGSSEIFTPKGFTADDNFNATMKLKLLEGRLFGPEFNDSLSVIINERAARAMGLENPVGTVLYNNTNPNTPIPYTIVGVVKDFHYESLHTDIAPLVIMSTEGQLTFQDVILVRLNTTEIHEALRAIENKWKVLVPNEPFIYSFLDNRLDKLYTSETSSGKLLSTFSVIAIIIACVGLFGLSAYTANQRRKEIGVRKVHGASEFTILKLLSKDFAILVLTALVIGSPLAWFMMQEWLSTFAFRTSLSLATFLAAGTVVMLFTIIAISYQAITAARINPRESLRDE